ncbi:hypothetical protein BC628DRAFT_366201 [Trametes gibbosa]|nr:hypothetical protein BC628DRAFT_366201 [Trametes gibbosa]
MPLPVYIDLVSAASTKQSSVDTVPVPDFPLLPYSTVIQYHMDRLSSQILLIIFELACVDGGQTGCSLSLTSKAVHRASRNARFNSIALSHCLPVDDPDNRVHTFLATYKEHSKPSYGDRPRVRHLYLAFTLGQNNIAMDYKRLMDDMHTLFREVNQDLYSLVIHIAPHPVVYLPWFFRLIDAPLPSLRELTVLGVPDPLLLASDMDSDSEPLFPFVQRLHIIQLDNYPNRTPPPEALSFADWMAHAPRTTHLRVSNLHYDASPFATELASALGVAAPIEWWELTTASHPLTNTRLRHPHLMCIVLQLCPPPPSHYVGSLWNAYMAYRRGLVNLSMYPTEQSLGLMLLTPPRHRRASSWAKRAKREWTKRIEGRAGCWDVIEGSREEIQALREAEVYL